MKQKHSPNRENTL